MNKENWISYNKHRPTEAGVFEWRLRSLVDKGLVLRFLTHMRSRGAGFETVLSPTFDYWNGYTVLVPDGTQWRAIESPPEFPKYEYRELQIEGVEHAPCPFCGEAPHWKAAQRSGSGIVVNATPDRLNTWWLECCKWAQARHVVDPIALANERNTLLAKPVCHHH